MGIRHFLLRLVVFSMLFIVVLMAFMAFVGLRYGHQIDAFYAKLTQPISGSIIIGTSRAAQALEGAEILKGNPEMLEARNFAFTAANSPYGPTYFEAIKKFSDFDGYDPKRYFLITIDPWSIREEKGKGAPYKEEGYFLGTLKLPPSNPNFEYMLRFGGEWWKFLALDKVQEVSPTGRHVLKFDSINVVEKYNANLQYKLKTYLDNPLFINGQVAQERVKSLKDIIQFGKQHGKVVLLRLPISPELMTIENQMSPEFDSFAIALANEFEVPYIDYTFLNATLQTTDGNHIWVKHGDRLSRMVGDSLARVK